MDEKQLASYIHKWSTILNRVGEINTCFEIGSNIGLNFMALGALFPHMEMCGVEINKKAAEECNKLKRVTVYNQSVLDFNTEKKFDLVFSSGF
jgi:spore coat polysaccharide biosynthesis protein SpsF